MEQLSVRSCDPLSLVLRLPQEIILNIISRLQVDSVLDCRIVCKTWRNLLPLLHNDNTYFADMHLHHQNKNSNSHTKSSFILKGYTTPLYYVEYQENDEQSYLKHKRIKLPLPADTWTLVGSCNGLICFNVRLTHSAYNPFYIFNPITREFVHLPRLIMTNDKQHKYSAISRGFGYHRPTNEYKVVRVYYCLNQKPVIGHVHVYTLGSGHGWRDKGETTHLLDYGISNGVLLDGALHWISFNGGNIVAFDLADEEFRCLPAPPCFDWRKTSKIWALGGWLCIVYGKTNVDVEIWLLKKNEEKQSASSNGQSWRWSREFTIAIEASANWMCQPFTITKSGEILLWYRRKSIVCCEPKPGAIPKKLLDLDEAIDVEQMISHLNSFISLKALGEDAEILL